MPSLGLGLGLHRGTIGFRGLLDNFGGAAAAYSLRALSSGWVAGDVVNVRRSSDSAQMGFTAAEVINGTLTTWTGAGDGFVVTWYDQSGNANNATQATTTAQPKIVEIGVLVVGGLDFDGTDDELLFTGSGLDILNNVAYAQSFNVGTSRETGTSTSNLLFFSNPSGQTKYVIGDSPSTAASFRLGGRRLDADSFDSETASSGHGNAESLWTGFLNFSDAESYLFRDGVNVATDLTFQTAGNTSATTSSASSGIGTVGFDGLIREVIIYTTDQTSNRTGIEGNQMTNYGI